MFNELSDEEVFPTFNLERDSTEKAKESLQVNDLSYLSDTDAGSNFVQDLQKKIRIMRQLENKALEWEALAKKARDEFEKYKATEVILAMLNAGLSSVRSNDGRFVRIEQKFYCNPNKNDADKQIIHAWLSERGESHLIETKTKTETSVNTHKLKAYIIDSLGYKGGKANMDLADIPDCVHFFIKQEVITD